MKNKIEKLYPDSKVELTPFIAKNYDFIMNFISFGIYTNFIKKAIKDIQINPKDEILDLGCGSGKNAYMMSKYLNEGKITGIDISSIAEKQFNKKLSSKGVFIKERIDKDFSLNKKFDKIFISFVIHGFPNEIRLKIIENVSKHLKDDGEFIILDFAEFDIKEMPFLYKFIFKTIECKYAFDFIEKDWKEILKNFGFKNFEEKFYLKNYIRLLKSKKI